MKIQSLAIIFILIILPITIVLSEYANAQTKTLQLETLYDSRLITATHDGLEAFQINTFNDTQSDIADSKISSIEASVNSFYNSMESGFGLQGYSKEDLKGYTPALVYTMYDGYYIYSPYTNIANIDETNGGLNIKPLSEENKTMYGLKPYVYYSCRYKVEPDSDFVITYSLDNYISIAGMINGEYVKKSGYLISPSKLTYNGGDCKYDGIEIPLESGLLNEWIIDPEFDEKRLYSYAKLNGVKYYLDRDNEYIFYLLNGTKVKQAIKDKDEGLYNRYLNVIDKNMLGRNYYINAYKFTKWLINDSGLKDLKASNAVDKNGNSLDLSGGAYTYIFREDGIPFEYPNSNFNEQRKAVIRYSIESNLSVAIANFNKYSNSSTNDFQMPKLKETEWELIEGRPSIISFLQGLSIGGKVYNGHTVVINNKTEEVVQDEDIYITTMDGYYHRVNEVDLYKKEIGIGVLATDFEIRKDPKTGMYFLHKEQLGDYTSIINQEKVNHQYNSIYEYLASLEGEKYNELKKWYYVALGRERESLYKTENPSNMLTLLKLIISAYRE